MDKRGFTVEVHYNDGEVEKYSYAPAVSIDHVKRDILKRTRKLAHLSEEEKKRLQIGTLAGDVMDIEFVRFNHHEAVKEEIQNTGAVKVSLRTQKEWAKYSRQSRRRGTIVGGPDQTKGLALREEKKQPVMLTSKAGESVIVFCTERSTVADIHSSAIKQLKAILEDLENSVKQQQPSPTKEGAHAETTPPLFYPPAGVTDSFGPGNVFEEIPYIDASRRCGNIPELFLNADRVPANVSQHSYDTDTDTSSATDDYTPPNSHRESGDEIPVLPLTAGGWSRGEAPPINQHQLQQRSRRGLVRNSRSLTTLPSLAQQRVDLRFSLPGSSTNSIHLKDIPITELLGAVKTKLWEQLNNNSSGGDQQQATTTPSATTGDNTATPLTTSGGSMISSMSRYGIKISHTHVYLPSDSTPLYEIPVVKFCVKKGLTVSLTLVDKEESNKDKLISLQIGNILGRPLCWTHTDTDETSFFRHKISKALTGTREKFVAAKAAKVTTAPLPSELSLDDVLVLIYMPMGDGTRTLHCKGEEKVTEIIDRLCRKSASKHYIDANPSSYYMKICGREEYIVHDVQLDEIEHVRECVKRRNKISFNMVLRSTVTLEDVPPERLAKGLLELSSLKEEEDKSRQDNLTQQEPQESNNETSVEKPAPREEEQLESLFERELRVQGTASLFELKKNFEFKVVGLAGVKLTEEDPSTQTFVQAALYHGGEMLCEATYSQTVNAQGEPHWNQWLRFDILMCQLPKATRLCLSVFLRDGKSKRPLGWVNCQLFDYRGYMLTGVVSLKMWPDAEANPIGTCVENLGSKTAPRLMLLFHEYPQPVVFPEVGPIFDIPLPDPPSPAERKKLKRIVTKDPLYQLGLGDKKLLWKYRGWLRSVSVTSLVKLLQSVPWTNPTAVREVHGLLELWGPIRPVDALELLDAKFADERVRRYAVNCLRPLSDSEFASYLLQLVQVLKYEPYHYSELAGFLMERALKNRITIGHYFFWHLQAEMHVAEIAERYGLLLEAYLRGCGEQRDDLIRQMTVIKALNGCALKVKEIPMAKRKEHLQMLLGQLSLPDKFTIPLNPTMSGNGIVITSCRCMDSAKVPLWIAFKNADSTGQPIHVIFKSGDDLRQDLLTLQMLGIMDKLWKEAGIDLHLTPYGCIATGQDMGMIEVVLESDTTANIQKAAGGVTAAFQQTPLAEWLQSNNQTEELYKSAVNNFIRSCSGYCIATYVLGIGDRHNDNIMVRKDGHLFHIDFGHFLGNFKKFLLYRREKAPFVLTPEFAFVMGGKDDIKFQQFVDLCCIGYNAARHHANVFINLFAMMLSTGIPELTCEQDIDYLRDAFSLDLDDDDATEEFTKLIFESLNTKTTQINFFIHNLFHRN